MVSIKSTLMAVALGMVVNGYAIPHMEKRGDGVFSLGFNVVEGPARNKTLKKSKRDTPEETLISTGISYNIDLVVGSQKDPVTVSIDTGSSDLWVVSKEVKCETNNRNCSSGGTFDQTKSTTWIDLKQGFFTIYGDYTSAIGTFGKDSVGFASGPILSEFQFAVATTDTAGAGILGIGQIQSEADAALLSEPTYPNFPQVLKDQGYINKVAYSLYLNEKDAKTGNIVFGGYDSDKYEGSLVKLPIESEIYLQVTLGSTTSAGGNNTYVNSSVLLDSGTTYNYLPQAVVDAVGADLAQNSTSGTPSCDQPDKLYKFNFDGVSISVPYSELIAPGLNNDGSPAGYCLQSVFAGSADTGFILGDSFLRYAYVLYDLEDRYISLAQVKYTDSSNLVAL